MRCKALATQRARNGQRSDLKFERPDPPVRPPPGRDEV